MTIYISKGSVSYLVNQNNFMTKYKDFQTSNSSCDSKNNLRLQESSRSTRVMKRSYINIMYHINHQSFQKNSQEFPPMFLDEIHIFLLPGAPKLNQNILILAFAVKTIKVAKPIYASLRVPSYF